MAESPRITELRWGVIKAEGLPAVRDVKLWPGGGREWNWTETGTRHMPGIQIADLEELIANGARTIVLSRGMQRALLTSPGAIVHLSDLGIRFVIEETRQAAIVYNRLAALGEPVGGLFHSTC